MITEKLIRQYTKLQSSLIAELLAAHPGVATSKHLLDAPTSGLVIYLGDEWAFRKHGSGFRFSNLKDGIIVDAHKLFREFPSGVDGWRLASYLESLGESNADHRKLDEDLEALKTQGSLSAVSLEDRLYVESQP